MAKKIFILILIMLLTAACAAEPSKIKKAEPVLYPASSLVEGEMKWGYVDQSGKFIVAPEWDYVEPFSEEGVAIVTRDGKAGLLGTGGAVILEPKYEGILGYYEGLAVAVIDGQEYDVLDTAGKVLFTRTGIVGYYKEGRVNVQNPEGLYGYADTMGKDVIVPQFIEAGAFENGKALVKTTKGNYLLIDSTGKTLQTYAYETMWSAGEDMYVYGIANAEGALRYGYVNAQNTVVLEAEMDEVGEFHDGRAVVGQMGGDGPLNGIVNKKGERIVPMVYGGLEYLGDDLYGVIKKTSFQSYQATAFQKAAIMNSAGKILTEEKYYNLKMFDDGVLSASDGLDTFLMDPNGKSAISGITVKGVGTLYKQGDVIRADVDNRISYYTPEGKIFWEQERIRSYKSVTVKTESKRFDRFTFIEYPVIGNLQNKSAEEKINNALHALMVKPYENLAVDPEAPSDMSLAFSERVMGSLLEVQSEGYAYTMGAAHGMSWTDIWYFDLQTGDRYLLMDLFYPDNGADVILSQEIKRLIPQGELAEVVDPEAIEPISGDHSFRLQEGGLEIIYQAYEIAPYAAGQPSFTVPWGKLEDIVDKEGPFWKAYKVQ